VYNFGRSRTEIIAFKEDRFMHPVHQAIIEIEIQIEELEPKVAPDGGETVLPLHHHHH
jgi:hypothetical protein